MSRPLMHPHTIPVEEPERGYIKSTYILSHVSRTYGNGVVDFYLVVGKSIDTGETGVNRPSFLKAWTLSVVTMDNNSTYSISPVKVRDEEGNLVPWKMVFGEYVSTESIMTHAPGSVLDDNVVFRFFVVDESDYTNPDTDRQYAAVIIQLFTFHTVENGIWEVLVRSQRHYVQVRFSQYVLDCRTTSDHLLIHLNNAIILTRYGFDVMSNGMVIADRVAPSVEMRAFRDPWGARHGLWMATVHQNLENFFLKIRILEFKMENNQYIRHRLVNIGYARVPIPLHIKVHARLTVATRQKYIEIALYIVDAETLKILQVYPFHLRHNMFDAYTQYKSAVAFLPVLDTTEFRRRVPANIVNATNDLNTDFSPYMEYQGYENHWKEVSRSFFLPAVALADELFKSIEEPTNIIMISHTDYSNGMVLCSTRDQTLEIGAVVQDNRYAADMAPFAQTDIERIDDISDDNQEPLYEFAMGRSSLVMAQLPTDTNENVDVFGVLLFSTKPETQSALSLPSARARRIPMRKRTVMASASAATNTNSKK